MYTAEQYAKLAQLYVESLERYKTLETLYKDALDKLKDKNGKMPWDEEQ